MQPVIVLYFETGNFEQGFVIKLQSINFNQELVGRLSANPEIEEVYREINSLYEDYRKIKSKSLKQKLNEKYSYFENQLNEWLNSESFQIIRSEIIQIFTHNQNSRLFIQATHPVIWQLPWHQWNILRELESVEVTLCFPITQQIKLFTPSPLRNRVRILTVIGNTKGIKVEDDITEINNIIIENKTEIKIIPERNPQELNEIEQDASHKQQIQLSRRELYDVLWEYQQSEINEDSEKQVNEESFHPKDVKFNKNNIGWDILIFTGHSKTEWFKDRKGVLQINSQEWLSIAELRSAIKSALAFGLKFVIFNSCDGLGLAKNLADLQIPYVIVMREEVHDNVASNFIKNFLKEFVQNGEPIHIALSKARTELAKIEKNYPLASWLPVLCQSSPNITLTWEELSQSINKKPDWSGCCLTLFTLDALQRLQNNILTKNKGVEIEDIYVAPNLGLLQKLKPGDLQTQVQKQVQIPIYGDYQLTQKYQLKEFLEKVVRRRNSPVSQGKRLAIIGEAGAGKSLLLQRIGDWIYWDLNRLVIWVSLASVNRKQTLDNYLLTTWLNRVKTEAKMSWVNQEQIVDLFASGNVWLLLDGVDEMNTNFGEPLGEITRQISQSNFISQSNIILTCRLNVWEANKKILQQFDVFRVLDFTTDDTSNMFRTENGQVTFFIERWFASNPNKGQELIQNLRMDSNKQIRDLSTNPLRLSLLCLVWETETNTKEKSFEVLEEPEISKNTDEEQKSEKDKRLSDFLNSRAALYDRFVQSIYEWKERLFRKESSIIVRTNERLTLDQGKIEQLNRDLAILAKKAFEHKLIHKFTLSELEKVAETQHPVTKFILPVIKNVVAKSGIEQYDSPFHIPHVMASIILKSNLNLALQLGWLNQVGTSRYNSNEPIYAFFHPTFHQYFAAKAIDEDEYQFFIKHSTVLPPPYGTYRAFDAKWQEVMLLWFGREDVLDLYKQLLIEGLWKFKDGCGGFYTYQAKFLAAAALAEFKNCGELEEQLTDNYEKTKVTVGEIIDEIGKTSFVYENEADEDDLSLPFKAFQKRAKIAFARTNSELAEKWLINLINKITLESSIAPALFLDNLAPAHKSVIKTLLEDFKQTFDEELNDNNKKDATERYKYNLIINLIFNAKGNKEVINQLIKFLSNQTNEETQIETLLVLGCIANTDDRMTINATKSVLVIIEAIDKIIQFFEKNLIGSDSTSSKISKYSSYFGIMAEENPNIVNYLINKLTQLLEKLLQQTDKTGYEQYIILENKLHIAQELLEISPVNQLAMNTLIELALTYTDYDSDTLVFGCWKKVGKDNPFMIHSLCSYIQEFDETKGTYRFFSKTFDVLGEIGFGEPIVIDFLNHHLEITEDDSLHFTIAKNLLKIDPDNIKAINTLQDLMKNAPSVDSRVRAAKLLAELSEQHREEVINTLISWQKQYYQEVMEFLAKSSINTNDIDKCLSNLAKESEAEYGRDAEKSLYLRNLQRKFFLISDIFGNFTFQKIARNYPQVIAALTELILNIPASYTQYSLVKSLGMIDPGNPFCIKMWMQFYDNEVKEDERKHIATSFWSRVYHEWVTEVGDRNRRQMIIDALTKIIQSTEDKKLQLDAAKTLGKFDSGNSLAISTLIGLVLDGYPGHFSHPVAALQEIIQGEKAEIVAIEIVRNLQELLNETHDNLAKDDNYDRLEYLLELFWVCAETLPYPEFYRVWRNLPKNYHLKPIYVGLSQFMSAANFAFGITYYILHPRDLLIKIFSIILSILKGLFLLVVNSFSFLILVIIAVTYPISWFANKYLRINIKRTLMSVLGLFIGIIGGSIIYIILPAIVMLVSLPLVLGLAVIAIPIGLIVMAIIWIWKKFRR
ncbi:MAG: hypothetical protein RLZZ507_903 [Cyanobacteriota bacterium]|jgi:predicted NACHT family NTPase